MLQRKCIFLLMNIVLVTVAREPACPACSRYDFEERLLERVLRNELVIETMLKETRETNVKVESALKQMHEDRSRLENTLNGLEKSKTVMDSEVKGTLHVALKNMSDSLAFMELVQEEMGTKLRKAITTAKTNITSAVSEMTQNATITGLQLKKENEILKDQLTIPTIYFHANTPAAYNLVTGQDVVYTSVRVNEGQGYDPKNGIFTVSVPGLYLFTVQYGVAPSTLTYLAIAHQGTQIQPSFSHSVSGSLATFSMQVFVRAAMSDRVWVESFYSDTKLHGSGPHNSFTGALIHM